MKTKTNVELIHAIRGSLPAQMEWTERDQAILALAEAQARDLDRLEAFIETDGGLPAFREARNQRVTLGRLVGLVDIPAEESTASLHAAKAARARWGSRPDFDMEAA